ncbi:unnamed protein product [Periconia digitata]|uniref:Mannan endo-1,6-alpha-mannosidase n=1 Tax=Periconia digitata TaxID=1303443 RepID=A0A9W4XKW0_9PLEO|nr:unnamed protein product [Periconia digitata]
MQADKSPRTPIKAALPGQFDQQNISHSIFHFISFFFNMRSSLQLLSLLLTFSPNALVAAKLDVNDQNSIKNISSTAASAIIKSYKYGLEQYRITGLFEILEEEYLWGATGEIWNSMLEYSHLTGDTQFNEAVASGLLHQTGERIVAFMPENQTKILGNRDQSQWGLAAMTAAEINLDIPKDAQNLKGPESPPVTSWLDLAKTVFDTQLERWGSEECSGGLHAQIFPYNNGFTIKSTGENGNFLLLAARLARFTGNKTYVEWAEKSFEWSKTVGLVKDFRVLDSSDIRDNCTMKNDVEWAAYHAAYTEASAIMYNITNATEPWITAIDGFANTSSAFLHEEKLYDIAHDQQKYDPETIGLFSKTVVTRSYARAMKAAPHVSEKLQKIVSAAAVQCATPWEEKMGSGNTTVNGSIELLEGAVNALAATQALLWPQAKALAPDVSNSTNSTTADEGGATSGADANKPGASGNAESPKPEAGKSGAPGQPGLSLGLLVGLLGAAISLL